VSLFNSKFCGEIFVDREKLLAICEKKIARGENQKAISLAAEYIKRGISTTSYSIEQKDLDMGCSYYIIAKALFNSFKASPDNRIYDYFKLFFHAHFHAYGVFQDFPPESEFYSYFKQVNSFADDIYETYPEKTIIERADRDANEEISKIRRTVSSRIMSLEDML
jgi:hypothetical protein